MFKSLFRKMAPLVAGVLVASIVTLPAAYPYIQSITKGSTSASVSVATGGSIPPGHTGPRSTMFDNYYWWVDQNFYDSNKIFITIPSATTNVNVYVYPDDGSGNYSYAYVNDVWGTVIYNGP